MLRVICWACLVVELLGLVWVGVFLWLGLKDGPKGYEYLMGVPLAAPPMLVGAFVLWFATVKARGGFNSLERRVYLGTAGVIGVLAAIGAILS